MELLGYSQDCSVTSACVALPIGQIRTRALCVSEARRLRGSPAVCPCCQCTISVALIRVSGSEVWFEVLPADRVASTSHVTRLGGNRRPFTLMKSSRPPSLLSFPIPPRLPRVQCRAMAANLRARARPRFLRSFLTVHDVFQLTLSQTEKTHKVKPSKFHSLVKIVNFEHLRWIIIMAYMVCNAGHVTPAS